MKTVHQHQRCNEPAKWYSPYNGYRACDKHANGVDALHYFAESGPEPLGRCDHVIKGRRDD